MPNEHADPKGFDPLHLRLLRMSPEHMAKVGHLREAYVALSLMLTDVPNGREKSLAATNLEQSLMWAVKAFCVASPQDEGQNAMVASVLTKSVQITINGKVKQFLSDDGRADYETLVKLAGMSGRPSMVIYWRPEYAKGREGYSLTPEQNTVIEEGMVVNVVHTDNT